MKYSTYGTSDDDDDDDEENQRTLILILYSTYAISDRTFQIKKLAAEVSV